VHGLKQCTTLAGSKDAAAWQQIHLFHGLKATRGRRGSGAACGPKHYMWLRKHGCSSDLRERLCVTQRSRSRTSAPTAARFSAVIAQENTGKGNWGKAGRNRGPVSGPAETST
jgi:hypothetical protein